MQCICHIFPKQEKIKIKLKQHIRLLAPVTDLYFRFILVNIPLVLLLRIVDSVFLNQLNTFYPPPSFHLLLSSIITDTLLHIKILVCLFPAYYLLFLIHKRLASVVWFFCLFLFLALSVVLTIYTACSTELLDSVITSYNYEDAIHVIQPYLYLLGWLISIPVVFFAVALALYFVLKKHRWSSFGQMRRSTKFSLLLLFTVITILPHDFVKGMLSTKHPFDEVILTNKLSYLLSDIASSINKPKEELLIKDYQRYFPQRKFTSVHYPLLHKSAEYHDVLSPYFNSFESPPNLVFVVMESMGRDISGRNATLNSFTPFLDSLAEHSLSWDNFVSTCERTYNVMPSLFGSLPYAEKGFVNLAEKQPPHYSLIHNLKNNGYHTNFFYGGWGGFDRMNTFFHRQNIDYFLVHFGKKYSPMNLREKKSWGYGDMALFDRAMEIIDSVNTQPRLDIHLTLTNHQPWKFNEQKAYINKLRIYLDKSNFSESTKERALTEKNKYSAILYADDALRKMMAAYKKRPGYENTIFIFTGDHAIWNNPLNGIKRYHVPFLIYSPKLKHGKRFPAVNTHLDVAPSIEAFLSSKFGLHFPAISHYLGFTFDTVPYFRNQRTQIFKLSKKKVKHLIAGTYYLDDDDVFLLDSLLNTTPVENSLLKKKLINQRGVINTIHENIPNLGTILPEKDYYANNPIYPYFPIHLQTEESKSFLSEIKTEYQDTSLYLSENTEYFGFASLSLKKNCFNLAYFYIDFNYDVVSKQKNCNVSLNISGNNSGGEMIFWKEYPLDETKTLAENFSVKETLVLSQKNLRDCSEIKIYLWNKNTSALKIIGEPKIYLSLE